MSVVRKAERQRGLGSEERPVTAALWERDSVGPNAAMRAGGDYEPDNPHVDYRRYFDPAWFQAELDTIWRRQWLFACREEDIPRVGDRIPFHVGPLSFVIVRAGPEAFKAFYNSCLHRGTMLCDRPQTGEGLRCPFHGWEWSLDGRLKHIPSHWDFTGVTRANGSLREVRLARWGGFIFINADPEAPPLEEALSVLPEHFRQFAPERRYTRARFRRLIHANWKLVQEAFMESYHVVATHPEGLPFTGDVQSQYDIWSTRRGAVGREAVPGAVASLHAPPEATATAAAEASVQLMQSWHYPKAEAPAFDARRDLRAQTGAWARGAYEQAYSRKPDAPDAVMLDSILYFMFPHFCVWLSELVPFVYQFTPHPTDPEKSYFEVRLLAPCAEGEPAPPSAPAVEIGPEESVLEHAPAFNFLGMIFDQDMANLPLVQRGLRAADPRRFHSELGAYQESLIQHWHELFDRFVGGDGQQGGRLP
jgi:phenylpropionate dioxygenase-like ring-hydroxylating dioxygenase large terminal subunit